MTQAIRTTTVERAIGETFSQENVQKNVQKNVQSGVEVLKVSSHSRPSAVAGAIAGVIRERGIVEVQSIGAGATNQAIKAVAIARNYLVEEGKHICCTPSFTDVMIDDQERTAIRLLIEQR